MVGIAVMAGLYSGMSSILHGISAHNTAKVVYGIVSSVLLLFAGINRISQILRESLDGNSARHPKADQSTAKQVNQIGYVLLGLSMINGLLISIFLFIPKRSIQWLLGLVQLPSGNYILGLLVLYVIFCLCKLMVALFTRHKIIRRQNKF